MSNSRVEKLLHNANSLLNSINDTKVQISNLENAFAIPPPVAPSSTIDFVQISYLSTIVSFRKFFPLAILQCDFWKATVLLNNATFAARNVSPLYKSKFPILESFSSQISNKYTNIIKDAIKSDISRIFDSEWKHDHMHSSNDDTSIESKTYNTIYPPRSLYRLFSMISSIMLLHSFSFADSLKYYMQQLIDLFSLQSTYSDNSPSEILITVCVLLDHIWRISNWKKPSNIQDVSVSSLGSSILLTTSEFSPISSLSDSNSIINIPIDGWDRDSGVSTSNSSTNTIKTVTPNSFLCNLCFSVLEDPLISTSDLVNSIHSILKLISSNLQVPKTSLSSLTLFCASTCQTFSELKEEHFFSPLDFQLFKTDFQSTRVWGEPIFPPHFKSSISALPPWFHFQLAKLIPFYELYYATTHRPNFLWNLTCRKSVLDHLETLISSVPSLSELFSILKKLRSSEHQVTESLNQLRLILSSSSKPTLDLLYPGLSILSSHLPQNTSIGDITTSYPRQAMELLLNYLIAQGKAPPLFSDLEHLISFAQTQIRKILDHELKSLTPIPTDPAEVDALTYKVHTVFSTCLVEESIHAFSPPLWLQIQPKVLSLSTDIKISTISPFHAQIFTRLASSLEQITRMNVSMLFPKAEFAALFEETFQKTSFLGWKQFSQGIILPQTPQLRIHQFLQDLTEKSFNLVEKFSLESAPHSIPIFLNSLQSQVVTIVLDIVLSILQKAQPTPQGILQGLFDVFCFIFIFSQENMISSPSPKIQEILGISQPLFDPVDWSLYHSRIISISKEWVKTSQLQYFSSC